jgi:hypothetical protein
MIRVVNLAEEAWLDLITDVDMTLRLFQNDVDAGLTEAQKDARVAGNFTEATFTGYAAVSMTTAWTTTAGDPSEATRAAVTFTSSANQSAQVIRGYYVTRNSDGQLCWYEYFPGPFTVSLLNDAITVTPRLVLDDRETDTVVAQGIVRQQVLTANGSALTVDADTDLTLLNVPVVAGRSYRIEVDSRWNLTVAAGAWALEVMVDGVKIGECAYIDEAAAAQDYVSGGCDWNPSVTGATSDIVIRANEVSGASTLTRIGATTVPSRLKLVDQGVQV